MGNSDADVVLHSLTDALLGAVGKGDIGEHFPDNTKKWKDAVKKFTSLSRSRSLIAKVKNAASFRPSDFSPEVSLKLALTDSYCDMNMGETAELLAREYNISRQEQDEFALNLTDNLLQISNVIKIHNKI